MAAPGTEPRASLDRARVTSAGMILAAADGLDAVSMRALATRLDVVPMALYKHVSDKEDLIGGMVDAIVSGYAAPQPGLPWRDAVRARAMAAREAMLAHPWLADAIESCTTRTEVVLDHMNAVAGEFIDGGVSADLAHYAMHALGNRIWGYSPEAFTGGLQTELPAEQQEALMQTMFQRFPHVTAIALDSSSRNPTGACDADYEFEFTLDLLLDAFERLHTAGWTSR